MEYVCWERINVMFVQFIPKIQFEIYRVAFNRLELWTIIQITVFCLILLFLDFRNNTKKM